MRRKAFTLIELVIVMAIVAILSSMFIMSASESQRSADVTNIFNNLQNLRIAALTYYADNVGKNFGRDLTSAVKAYTHDWDNVRNGAHYYVINDATNKVWYAAYWVREPAAFKQRIHGRASSLGLLGTNKSINESAVPEAKPGTYNNHNFALIKIRSGNK